jgi:hypothetical protein
MEFMDSYYIWKQLRVPVRGVDEETGDLGSDLLVSDGYLLSISNLVEHGTFSPPVVDVLGYLDKMMLRAKKMMAEGVLRCRNAPVACMHMQHFPVSCTSNTFKSVPRSDDDEALMWVKNDGPGRIAGETVPTRTRFRLCWA